MGVEILVQARTDFGPVQIMAPPLCPSLHEHSGMTRSVPIPSYFLGSSIFLGSIAPPLTSNQLAQFTPLVTTIDHCGPSKPN